MSTTNSPTRSVARKRVLLVEDEEALRIGTARLSEEHGYVVVVAGDGVEALAVVGPRVTRSTWS